jgi:hypothetical protein
MVGRGLLHAAAFRPPARPGIVGRGLLPQVQRAGPRTGPVVSELHEPTRRA